MLKVAAPALCLRAESVSAPSVVCIHACLGAPLARMEARIALADFLERVQEFKLASDEPWEPRKALQVHGPSRLSIRFTPASRAAAVS